MQGELQIQKKAFTEIRNVTQAIYEYIESSWG
jgi:hypothetical protein